MFLPLPHFPGWKNPNNTEDKPLNAIVYANKQDVLLFVFSVLCFISSFWKALLSKPKQKTRLL